MKRRTALAIVLALIVFVGVWVFVYFVEMSNTTRAVVWLVACVVILASQWIVLSGSKHLGGYFAMWTFSLCANRNRIPNDPVASKDRRQGTDPFFAYDADYACGHKSRIVAETGAEFAALRREGNCLSALARGGLTDTLNAVGGWPVLTMFSRELFQHSTPSVEALASSTRGFSFDHLVGEGEQCRRHFEANRFRRFDARGL